MTVVVSTGVAANAFLASSIALLAMSTASLTAFLAASICEAVASLSANLSSSACLAAATEGSSAVPFISGFSKLLTTSCAVDLAVFKTSCALPIAVLYAFCASCKFVAVAFLSSATFFKLASASAVALSSEMFVALVVLSAVDFAVFKADWASVTASSYAFCAAVNALAVEFLSAAVSCKAVNKSVTVLLSETFFGTVTSAAAFLASCNLPCSALTASS